MTKNLPGQHYSRKVSAAALCGWLALCAPFALSACTDGKTPQSSSASTSETVAPADKVETVAPIPTPMETFKQLQPPAGIKFTQLFNQPAGSDEERFKRLESAVQGMRNDLDTVMPAMVRMVNMEDDLRDLVGQLRSINGETSPSDQDGMTGSNAEPLTEDNYTPDTSEDDEFLPSDDAEEQASSAPQELAPEMAEDTKAAAPVIAKSSPTPKAAAVAKPPKKAQKIQKQIFAAEDGDGFLPAEEHEVKPASAAVDAAADAATTPAGLAIKSVRVGDHDAVTRIVLDASAKPGYKAHIEKDGLELVIDLPEAVWSAKVSGALKNKKAVSYKYEDGHVGFALAAPMEIKTQQVLSPGNGAGYRIMIDLVTKAP